MTINLAPQNSRRARPRRFGLIALIGQALWHRRLSVALTVVTLALSVALFLSVSRLQTAAKTSFLQTVSGIDLIVAPRDSDVNVLLYSVFGIGAPSSVLSAEVLETIRQDSDVAWIVPAALGDTHRGFQVLGTTPDFFDKLRLAEGARLTWAQGHSFEQAQQLVLGAEVARRLGYGLGQRLILNHGQGEALTQAARHQERPFTVVGVMAATGTPFDRRLYVSLADFDSLHEARFLTDRRTGAEPEAAEHAAADPEEARNEEARNEEARNEEARNEEARNEEAGEPGVESHHQSAASFAFVGLNAPSLALRAQARFQRQDASNQQSLTAVIPGLSLARLWGLIGQAEAALRLISMLVLAVALLGLAAMLVANLNERRREMAIFRALGARPRDIAGLLLAEAAVVGCLGLAVGLAVTQAASAALAGLVAARFGLALAVAWPSVNEFLALAAIFCAALIAGLIPAGLAYRQTLSDGLVPHA